jgi:hypothetical protein
LKQKQPLRRKIMNKNAKRLASALDNLDVSRRELAGVTAQMRLASALDNLDVSRRELAGVTAQMRLVSALDNLDVSPAAS